MAEWMRQRQDLPVEPGNVIEEAPGDTQLLEGIDEGSLVGRMLNWFLTAKYARRWVETVWIKAIRNNKGLPDLASNLQEGYSKAIVHMTAPKIDTAAAIINSVLLPDGKTVWDIDTTPDPYIQDFAKFYLREHPDATLEDVDTAVYLEAKRRCANLQKKVNDGYAECEFKTKLSDSSFILALQGNSVFCGPFYATRTRKKVKGMSYTPVKTIYADVQEVDPFEVYPDPGAKNVRDALYICRRRVMNKPDLSALRNADGFDKGMIESIIESTPNGNWYPEAWESELRNINNTQQIYGFKDRYIVYDFWARLSGEDLRQAGVDIPDDQKHDTFMANVWITNGKIIRAAISDFHAERIPYYITRCKKSVNSIWGVGFAERMFDAQAAASACERAANDNMAYASRPQAVVNLAMSKIGGDSLKPHPGKTWYVHAPSGSTQKPIEFFFPPSNLQDISARQGMAYQRAAEGTGIPDFLQGINGQGTHNRTLGGATLQWNNSTNPFRTVITNVVNDLITPLTEKMAEFYLTYQYSEDIDADYKVTCDAVSGLAAKEGLVNSLMQMLNAIANQPYWQYRINDKRVGEIIQDAYQVRGEGIFLSDLEAKAKQEQIQNTESKQAPKQQPEVPQKDGILKILQDTDKGTAAYPCVLEEALNAFDMLEGKPATQSALEIMRREAAYAHRAFTTPQEAQTLNGGFQPAQSGPTSPEAVAIADQPGVGQLPLGVKSLGTPAARSLGERPERYKAVFPQGVATNPSDFHPNGVHAGVEGMDQGGMSV